MTPTELKNEISSVILEIDELPLAPEGDSVGKIPINDLRIIKSKLEEMRAELLSDCGVLPGKRQYGMTRMIMDQWPLGSSLGNRISEIERAYLAL